MLVSSILRCSPSGALLRRVAPEGAGVSLSGLMFFVLSVLLTAFTYIDSRNFVDCSVFLYFFDFFKKTQNRPGSDTVRTGAGWFRL